MSQQRFRCCYFPFNQKVFCRFFPFRLFSCFIMTNSVKVEHIKVSDALITIVTVDVRTFNGTQAEEIKVETVCNILPWDRIDILQMKSHVLTELSWWHTCPRCCCHFSVLLHLRFKIALCAQYSLEEHTAFMKRNRKKIYDIQFYDCKLHLHQLCCTALNFAFILVW